MGWNTSALFVADRSVEDVLGLLPGVHTFTAAGEIDGEVATSGLSSGRLNLARTGAWCEMWDPDYRFPLRVDGLTRALAVLFSSVSSTYGFWLHGDGRLVRHVLFVDGEAVADEGDPLPVEAEIAVPSWGPDEDFLWAVIEHVTGIGFDVERTYTSYTVGP